MTEPHSPLLDRLHYVARSGGTLTITAEDSNQILAWLTAQEDHMAGPIKLGKKYRDEITGFEGTATARTDYLYGCVRVSLEGKGNDGEPQEWVFDEQRLVALDGSLPEPTATSGGARRKMARTGPR